MSGFRGKGKRPIPPFFGVRVLSNIPVDEVFTYINEHMLFNIVLGIKDRDEYRPLLKDLKEEVIRKRWLDLKGVYGYFRCRTLDKGLEILEESGRVIEKFCFSNELDSYDTIAFQTVTVGNRINDAIEYLNQKEEFNHALFIHGLAVSLAEALAAYVHNRIRREMGLGKNQGKRYSPGYPIWKDISDQAKIFKLLNVEKNIGVHLTEAFQMVPEQSTSAIVVY